MADEDKQSAHPAWGILCVVAGGLCIGGIVWMALLCKHECNCSPDRCCEAGGSCPSEKPCSCLSDANDWSVASCEEEDNNCDSLFPLALAMLVSGAFLHLSLVFCSFVMPIWGSRHLTNHVEINKQGKQPDVPEVELGTTEEKIH